MRKFNIRLKLLAIALSVFLSIPFNIVSHVAAATKTSIVHKSPKYYMPGFRINLDAVIKDEAGVLCTRSYFKAKKAKNFVFVDMVPAGGDLYKATLPSPWVNSESVEYVFVVVNKKKQVARSEVFSIIEKKTKESAVWKGPGEVKEIPLDMPQEAVEQLEALKRQLAAEYKGKLPSWQSASSKGELTVSTELKEGAEPLKGFYDNVNITEVSASSEKYGMVAEGLYPDTEIAVAGGKAAIAEATGASSVGLASSGGAIGSLSWVALAAVGGGAVALGGAGGGGGGSSSSSDDVVDVTDAGESDFVGTFSALAPPRNYTEYHSIFIFNNGGTGTIEEWGTTIDLPPDGDNHTGPGGILWSFNSATDTFSFTAIDTQVVFTGDVSGNTDNFTLTGYWAQGGEATLVLSRQ